MKTIRTRTAYPWLPTRQVLGRAGVMFLITVSIMMLIMSRNNNPSIERMRGQVMDVLVPVVAAATAPVNAIKDIGAWLHSAAALFSENRALKNENAQLLQWQAKAKLLTQENAALKQLLHVVPEGAPNYVTAPVVMDTSGPYVRALLVGGGAEQGMRKDQAVIHAGGLVGRVIEASGQSARVLLVTDINSRVPVMTESGDLRMILVGQNEELPSLSYLSTNAPEVGSRLVTSGDGGIFPKGIPVGIVESTERGNLRVRPFVDGTHIEFVTAIDYKL